MRSSLFCAYFSRFSSEVCYYNLSPQGDGNFHPLLRECRYVALQLIPARGRKRAGSADGIATRNITTYPRKGTETELQQTPWTSS